MPALPRIRTSFSSQPPPTTSPMNTSTDIATTEISTYDEYDAAYQLCLKAYNSMMEIQTPSILVTDGDDDATTTRTTPGDATATDAGQGSNSDWNHFKSFRTWHRAAASCGFAADGFMSLQVTKSSTGFPSTSNSLALEDAALSLSSSSGEETTSFEEESDDEESDVDPEELAARCQRRSRRQSVLLLSKGQCSPIVNTPLPAVAPQLPAPTSPTDEDPESFWARRSEQWTWELFIEDHETTYSFTMILTPPAEEDNFGSEAWIPIQSRSNLVVPGCFVVGTSERRHYRCIACTDYAQVYHDEWSQCQYGRAVSELATTSVEEQVSWKMHGGTWNPHVGTCVCPDWREFQERYPHVDIDTLDDLPLRWHWNNYALERYEEELPAQEPTQPAAAVPPAPPPSPMAMEAPLSPRWSDFGDDDELPDLDGWT